MSWVGKRFGAKMSLENMKLRLQYQGGNQQERMNKDKLNSLKKALMYSYQAATAKLADGREFRCLINRNKLSLDLDDKIISIPFDAEMKEGDVFEWAENSSHWIVFLRRLEETAYFRADIRRCRYEITLDNGHKYWGYIRGPVEQQVLWSQASGNYYNKLNYSLIMYLPQNEETLSYFHRFNKVTISGRPWEVQAVDDLSTPGLIQIHLKETFNNTIETDIKKAVNNSINVDIIDEKEETYIHGPSEIYPYDSKTYELRNYNGITGTWSIENASRSNMVELVDIIDNKVSINVITGRSGSFSLVYRANEQIVVALDITIGTL